MTSKAQVYEDDAARVAKRVWPGEVPKGATFSLTLAVGSAREAPDTYGAQPSLLPPRNTLSHLFSRLPILSRLLVLGIDGLSDDVRILRTSYISKLRPTALVLFTSRRTLGEDYLFVAGELDIALQITEGLREERKGDLSPSMRKFIALLHHGYKTREKISTAMTNDVGEAKRSGGQGPSSSFSPLFAHSFSLLFTPFTVLTASSQSNVPSESRAPPLLLTTRHRRPPDLARTPTRSSRSSRNARRPLSPTSVLSVTFATASFTTRPPAEDRVSLFTLILLQLVLTSFRFAEVARHLVSVHKKEIPSDWEDHPEFGYIETYLPYALSVAIVCAACGSKCSNVDGEHLSPSLCDY